MPRYPARTTRNVRPQRYSPPRWSDEDDDELSARHYDPLDNEAMRRREEEEEDLLDLAEDSDDREFIKDSSEETPSGATSEFEGDMEEEETTEDEDEEDYDSELLDSDDFSDEVSYEISDEETEEDSEEDSEEEKLKEWTEKNLARISGVAIGDRSRPSGAVSLQGPRVATGFAAKSAPKVGRGPPAPKGPKNQWFPKSRLQ